MLLIVVVEIQLKQKGPAPFAPLTAKIDLILPSSAARHDETFAEGDPALRFKLVETERPNDAIRRREKGAPAAFAILDTADCHAIENSQRAVPDDPFLFVRLRRAFMHEAAPRPRVFVRKGSRRRTVRASMHVQSQRRVPAGDRPASTARRRSLNLSIGAISGQLALALPGSNGIHSRR